jgi:putative sigma-54 modulation protein
MNTDVKAVHFDVTDGTRDYLERKLSKLDFAKDLIVDLLFTLTKEKNNFYKVESNINFRWGYSTHISTDTFDLIEGIDKLFDKIEMKVLKEKEKIQKHV